MPREFDRGHVGGDLVISEEVGPIITRESREYTNSTGADVEFPVGFPFTFTSTTATACVAATVGNANGILTQPVKVIDGETVKLNLLAKGPAAINQDRLPTVDLADVSFNMTTFKNRLVTLGLTLRAEPTVQQEHTT